MADDLRALLRIAATVFAWQLVTKIPPISAMKANLIQDAAAIALSVVLVGVAQALLNPRPQLTFEWHIANGPEVKSDRISLQIDPQHLSSMYAFKVNFQARGFAAARVGRWIRGTDAVAELRTTDRGLELIYDTGDQGPLQLHTGNRAFTVPLRDAIESSMLALGNVELRPARGIMNHSFPIEARISSDSFIQRKAVSVSTTVRAIDVSQRAG